MSDTIEISDLADVRIISLARPKKLNALNLEMTLDLLSALRAAQTDSAVGAIVLTAAGRAFCAGADISELRSDSGLSGKAVDASYRADLLLELHASFSQIDKSIIAAVNGLALGGGCGIALACDMVVASEDSTFGYPEAKLGGMPAIVMANLVRQLGRKAAYEMMALGDTLSARRAYELGLINRVVAPDRVLETAVGMAQAIANWGRIPAAAAKRLFYRAADLPLVPALEAARDANAIMRGEKMRWNQADV